MKIISSFVIAAALATAVSAETIQLEFNNNNGFEKLTAKGVIREWTYSGYSKTFKGGGKFTSNPAGYKGKCAGLKTEPGQRIYIYNAKAIPVKEGKDTVKISLWCKGKGSMQIMLYGYNDKNRNVGGWNGKSEIIDAPEWKQYTWTIPLKAYGKNITQIRIAPAVVKESDLLIDEMNVIIERTL